MTQTAPDPVTARPRPAPASAVSVVVITRNRRDELARSLTRLAALPEAPPVLVVDNGSTDGTAAMVRRRFPAVSLLCPGRNLGAAGRNLGVAAATTPYVAFCDDDTWWSPGSLQAAVEALDAHPRLAVVTARIVVEPDGTEDPVCADLRDAPLPAPCDLPGHPLVSFLAGASVVRRAAYLAVGGFEPHLVIGGEEELLAADLLAAGWGLAHLPALEIHHHASAQRDPHLRRRQGIRNTLWFTWLRRPLPAALRRTVALVRRLPADRVTAGALLDAAAGAAWVARRRRVVPPEVESLYRAMDAVQFDSGARCYRS